MKKYTDFNWDTTNGIYSRRKNKVGTKTFPEISKRVAKEMGDRSKDIKWWPSIPNCKKIVITMHPKEIISRNLEIEKSRNVINITPYENKNLNKYIKFQMTRLVKHRHNPTIFWTIAWWLLKHSVAFRVAAINRVFPGWYKKKEFWWIHLLWGKVSKLISDRNTDLHYTRVYIPKGDTWRPLGVPKPEWRVYLHMYNNMLNVFLDHNFLDSQHGGRKAKGTLTAWIYLIKNILPKKNIVEIDLQQCFPNIHTNRITEKLIEWDLPKPEAIFIENINRRQPELPEEGSACRLLDESKVDKINQQRHNMRHGIFDINDPIYDPYRHDFDPKHPYVYNEMLNEEVHLFEHAQLIWAMEPDDFNKVEGDWEGVAQGSALSVTSVLTGLRDWSKSWSESVVSYIDDMVGGSDHPLEIPNSSPNLGIIVHKEKSAVVKQNGIWLKPLKFLGLTYDPFNEKFYNSVHNKATPVLILEKDLEDIMIGKYDVSEVVHEYKTWHRLFSSSIGGLIQARLYMGSWTIPDLETNMELEYERLGWLMKYHKNDFLSVYNASSYACRTLAQWGSRGKLKSKYKSFIKVRFTVTKKQLKQYNSEYSLTFDKSSYQPW